MATQTYDEYKREQDKKASREAFKQTVKAVAKKSGQALEKGYGLGKSGVKAVGTILAPEPVNKANVRAIQAAPQTLLSKQQDMLNALFGSKKQFWGHNDAVRINQTLQTGNGLIKSNDDGETAAMFGRRKGRTGRLFGI